MSDRVTFLSTGRLLAALIACLALLGLALPLWGCGNGNGDKEDNGNLPPPPPGPRVVRFLNDKKPRPKLWVKQKVGSSTTDAMPSYEDKGTAEYDIDAGASEIVVVIDTDGSDTETAADYQATRALTKMFLDHQHLMKSGATGWSVHEFFAVRETPEEAWDVDVTTWP